MRLASPAPPGNRLLASLSDAESRRLAAYLEPVTLRLRVPIAAAGEPVGWVYFPHGAVASLVVRLPDGEDIEVGMVGPEGLAPLALLHDVDVASTTVVAQIGGDASRMSAQNFRRHVVGERGELYDLALRYAEYANGAVAARAACNARHTVVERLARWVLMAHDRAGRPSFSMTHEALALMLGVRRASVTEAAGKLRRRGALSYEHGTMYVADRSALETAACGCYAAQAALEAELLAEQAAARRSTAPIRAIGSAHLTR